MGTSVALPPGFELQPSTVEPPRRAAQAPASGALPGEQPRGLSMTPAAPRMPAEEPAQPAPAMAAALPPGFELQAPAAPPQREVGFLETAGRTAASAATPVVRMIDMAAAALAGKLAPMLGLDPEQEQAKIFKDSDARQARMREAYAPKAGEQMSTPGQIVGGIVSAPIEMTGGMGLQRGVDTAASVLERGGTGRQAAVAGGVSGAANLAANLIPVKAGGAVGRAVEQQLGRALPSQAAQVAGGALTGGVLGAAGDVGVTQASNAALPEGEQFAGLRQEADPLQSFGLGAAFGGAAARAQRAGGRQAARDAGEAPEAPPAGREEPAGSGARPGSVGASSADIERQRRERAAALPVPIELSLGEARGAADNQGQMQFEREQAKDVETGAPLREAAAEKNERLQRNLEIMIEDTGAEVGSGPDARAAVGEAVTGALHGRINEWRGRIQEAYSKAREAGDMAEPVSTDALVRYLNERGPESINAKVLQTVREKLVQLGGAKRDGEGGLVAGEMPINDLEEVRKMINRVSETPVDQHFGGEIKARIDSMTEDVGGELYREARRLRTEYGREFGDRAVINDLVRNKRGGADRAVALEDVFRRSVLRRSRADIEHLRGTLHRAGEAGQQAWKELQGQTLRHIQEAALRNSGQDIRGNRVVSAAGLDRAIRELDADGKLDAVFGKKGAEQLRDLNDVAQNVLTSPSGTVNASNTANTVKQLLKNAVDTMVTFSVSGMPVPALAVLGKATSAIRARKVRKQIGEALAQPEGLLPAQGAERVRFSAETPEVGGVTQAPAAAAETARGETPAAPRETPADPRLAEVDRLRAATTNPEALAVLDERRKKVEREIADSRREAKRFQQADELDALARSSTDPEVRKALAKRADDLRGGAIPVGEAAEVDIDTVAPVEPTQIPTGEAVELTPEAVEPAPRPTEAPRSAAGSDVDAELTMLQAGAPARGQRKQPMYKRAGDAPDTPEFKRWFGKSKVVDKDGNPMVVHHGTPSEFEVFDFGRIGDQGRAEGPGFYFTANRDVASGYGKPMDVYLSIQKPLAYDAKPFKKAVVERIVKRIAELESQAEGTDIRDGFLSNYGDTYTGGISGAAREAAQIIAGDESAIDQIGGIVGAGVSPRHVLKAVTEITGHDGVIAKGFSNAGDPADVLYVAFAPEQIKSATSNSGAFDPKDPNIMNKRGGLPAKPFKQRAELENALRAKLGHKLVDGLLQRNVITMGDAPADVPRDAQGRFTGSAVELFHDRLDAATAPGVLMHEVGMHYGMEKMLGAQRYAELLDDLRAMRQRPEVAKAWATVRRNYPDLNPDSPEFAAEVGAHLVETAPDRPIVRRMLDGPRAYLYSEFGVNVGKADPNLLRALAAGALRKSAGVEAVSPNPTALAAAGAREREEETAAQ